MAKEKGRKVSTTSAFAYNQGSLLAGEVGYLIEMNFQGSREPWWQVRREPGRTNLRGKARERGWLGSTDNVDEYAHGRVQVLSTILIEGISYAKLIASGDE